MSDAEVALELLKLALDQYDLAKGLANEKDGYLSLYRECLAAVRDRRE